MSAPQWELRNEPHGEAVYGRYPVRRARNTSSLESRAKRSSSRVCVRQNQDWPRALVEP